MLMSQDLERALHSFCRSRLINMSKCGPEEQRWSQGRNVLSQSQELKRNRRLRPWPSTDFLKTAVLEAKHRTSRDQGHIFSKL